MSELEAWIHTAAGEAAAGSAVLQQFLGRLSLRYLRHANTSELPIYTPQQLEVNPASAIVPYGLAEVSSPEQWIGGEHIEEFWGPYRASRMQNGSEPLKPNCVNVFKHLPNLKPLGQKDIIRSEIPLYLRRLGLRIIPRDKVEGFSPHMTNHSYLKDSKIPGLTTNHVVRASSLIIFIENLADKIPDGFPVNFNDLPPDWPAAIKKPQFDYLASLASQIAWQMQGVTSEAE